jgi:hypothetical protein
MGGIRNTYKVLLGKPNWKRSLGRRMPRWEENIKRDLRDVGWKVVDYIHLAQDRPVGGGGGGSSEHDNEPLSFTKVGKFD